MEIRTDFATNSSSVQVIPVEKNSENEKCNLCERKDTDKCHKFNK